MVEGSAGLLKLGLSHYGAHLRARNNCGHRGFLRRAKSAPSGSPPPRKRRSSLFKASFCLASLASWLSRMGDLDTRDDEQQLLTRPSQFQYAIWGPSVGFCWLVTFPYEHHHFSENMLYLRPWRQTSAPPILPSKKVRGLHSDRKPFCGADFLLEGNTRANHPSHMAGKGGVFSGGSDYINAPISIFLPFFSGERH